MKKYEVIDKRCGLKVGDIVTLAFDDETDMPLFELPEHLHGFGHDGLGTYKNDNYWWISLDQLKEIVE